MSDSNNEKGFKWWLRFIIVPIIVAIIGGFSIIPIVASLKQNSSNRDLFMIAPSSPPMISPTVQRQSEEQMTPTIQQVISQTPIANERALTIIEKCETIKNNFPQTIEEVRTSFGLPTTSRNYRLVYEECGEIATGFIFEGDIEFELSVPEGGCIDSYSAAYFSEQPVSESFGGLRVYSGIVRATGVTYRVAWCETKP